MTRIELIKLLEDSFRKYPTSPMDAEVMVLGLDGKMLFIEALKVTIIDGKPTVTLI